MTLNTLFKLKCEANAKHKQCILHCLNDFKFNDFATYETLQTGLHSFV